MGNGHFCRPRPPIAASLAGGCPFRILRPACSTGLGPVASRPPLSLTAAFSPPLLSHMVCRPGIVGFACTWPYYAWFATYCAADWTPFGDTTGSSALTAVMVLPRSASSLVGAPSLAAALSVLLVDCASPTPGSGTLLPLALAGRSYTLWSPDWRRGAGVVRCVVVCANCPLQGRALFLAICSLPFDTAVPCCACAWPWPSASPATPDRPNCCQWPRALHLGAARTGPFRLGLLRPCRRALPGPVACSLSLLFPPACSLPAMRSCC